MINYETLGNGKPLVLLHGWGFDKSIWQPLVPYLTEGGFKLYLIDLPGFGKTPNMGWEQFKMQLLAFLPQEFIVLGWSLGGLFATRLCIEEPARVVKLINVASSPKFISEVNWVGIETEVFADFYHQFSKNPKKTRYEFISSQLLKNLDLQLSDELNITGLANGLDILINWDLRKQLFNVKQPGLFIFGKLDAIVNRKLMPLLQSTYPDFKYIMFKKSAHIPFLSDSLKFVEVVVDFCKQDKDYE